MGSFICGHLLHLFTMIIHACCILGHLFLSRLPGCQKIPFLHFSSFFCIFTTSLTGNLRTCGCPNGFSRPFPQTIPELRSKYVQITFRLHSNCVQLRSGCPKDVQKNIVLECAYKSCPGQLFLSSFIII